MEFSQLRALAARVGRSRHEGFGIVVAEAMAASVTMVSTKEGAFPEFSDNGRCALLARARDSSDFARALAHFSANNAVCVARAACANSRASCFAREAIASRVLQTYSALLESGVPP